MSLVPKGSHKHFPLPSTRPPSSLPPPPPSFANSHSFQPPGLACQPFLSQEDTGSACPFWAAPQSLQLPEASTLPVLNCFFSIQNSVTKKSQDSPSSLGLTSQAQGSSLQPQTPSPAPHTGAQPLQFPPHPPLLAGQGCPPWTFLASSPGHPSCFCSVLACPSHLTLCPPELLSSASKLFSTHSTDS